MNRGVNARALTLIPWSSRAALYRRRANYAAFFGTKQHPHSWNATTFRLKSPPPTQFYLFPGTIQSHHSAALSSCWNSWFSGGKRCFSDRTSADSPEIPAADPSTESAAEESTDGADNEVPSASSSSKAEQLETEIKSLKDQLLRSLADQDNTRRIAQRDIEAARQFAIKSFAKSLLDVSDNLSRALEAVPKDEVEQAKGTTLATLYEGIEMTERGLTKAFEMNGLVKFGAEGEPFDPNQHEALFEYPDPSKTPGTVGQVMKAGFMLNKRVLRPAEVGIVKNPE
jgi:molecular chaperone GrpE